MILAFYSICCSVVKHIMNKHMHVKCTDTSAFSAFFWVRFWKITRQWYVLVIGRSWYEKSTKHRPCASRASCLQRTECDEITKLFYHVGSRTKDRAFRMMAHHLIGLPLFLTTCLRRAAARSGPAWRDGAWQLMTRFQAASNFISLRRVIACLLDVSKATLRHRFSAGLRSEDWAGHSSVVMLFWRLQLETSLARCHGALSSWNKKWSGISCRAGSVMHMHFCCILMYLSHWPFRRRCDATISGGGGRRRTGDRPSAAQHRKITILAAIQLQVQFTFSLNCLSIIQTTVHVRRFSVSAL